VDWFLRGEAHAGIIIATAAPRLPVSVMHRRLLNYLDSVTTEEMVNEVRWLDGAWSWANGAVRGKDRFLPQHPGRLGHMAQVAMSGWKRSSSVSIDALLTMIGRQRCP
jgi:hypothetical protein